MHWSKIVKIYVQTQAAMIVVDHKRDVWEISFDYKTWI